jgi:hypothetical protein
VVAARSMGIWERNKTTREKAGAAWERKEGVEAVRARRRRKTLVQITVSHTPKIL